MSAEPAARFFVNSGIVSGRVDMYHLLRPLLKQTINYRYCRGAAVVSHGAGWVERIVVDQPGVSSFFTPLSICNPDDVPRPSANLQKSADAQRLVIL